MLQRYVLLCFPLAFTISVDNDVVGEPQIECAPDAIGITFKTRRTFDGRLFVKGRFDDADCRNEQIGRPFTGIILHFETCGMSRLRSLVTFTLFNLEMERRKVEFYGKNTSIMLNDSGGVMKNENEERDRIQVAEVATALVSMFFTMPICRYEILSGGPDGTPVFFATVGQQVYHKWTCDSEYQDTFCMVVHSCIVDDGRGRQVETIDANGCAIDKHILANLDYPTDLMAAQEAHVFKYADRTALFFQCQISVTLKEKGTSCTRPSCRDPARQKSVIEYDDNVTLGDISTSLGGLKESKFRV
uniref:ZP domain-containing protein n=1 Tax=Parascaris univalens TaxID=6257 RepID=A0A915BSE3_PARUN